MTDIEESMKTKIDESEFLDALRKGIDRTKNLMALATEFHGDEVRTEYLITADIAREFIERDYGVAVECLNRHLVNGLTQEKGADVGSLRSKRTDVAVVESALIPLAIIEVKIGVSRLTKVKKDLDKITHTIGLMNAKSASRVTGAAVFQVHVGGSRSRYSEQHFRNAAEVIEARLIKEVNEYALTRQGFKFVVHPLQESDGGISARELEDIGDGDEKAWGRHGHATRYHVIMIRSTRPIPPPPNTISDLRNGG